MELWKEANGGVGRRSSTKGTAAGEIRRGMEEPGIGGGVAGIDSLRHMAGGRRQTERGECMENLIAIGLFFKEKIQYIREKSDLHS